MKKSLTALTLALLTLTACGSTEATSEPNIAPVRDSTTTAPEPIESAPPEEELSERGSLVLELGEAGTVLDAQNTELVTFLVKSIEVDPECTSDRPMEPENGHFIALDVEVSSIAAAAEHHVSPDLIFNKAGIRVIDSDGVTRSESANSGASFECLPDADQLPVTFGPGEKVAGKVVLDVPVDSGIILTELGIGENTQWEWQY